MSTIVKEDLQLSRSLEYFNKVFPSYSFENNDVIKASVSSSVTDTNMFKNIDYIVYDENYLLNQTWLNNRHNSNADFHDNIDENVILRILKQNSKLIFMNGKCGDRDLSNNIWMLVMKFNKL